MSFIPGTCSKCGAGLDVALGEVFAAASLVSALCLRCTDQQFLDRGGVILALQQELDGARFPLWKITITPGAVQALAESGEHAVAFLQRHVQGDWGAIGHCDQIGLTDDEQRRGWEATDDTGKVNKWNLLNGQDTILSEYVTARGKQIWIVTRLDRAPGTTVLVPEEY